MDLSLEAGGAIEAVSVEALRNVCCREPRLQDRQQQRGDKQKRRYVCKDRIPDHPDGRALQGACVLTGYEFRPLMEVGSVFVGRVGPWVGMWGASRDPRESKSVSFQKPSLEGSAHPCLIFCISHLLRGNSQPHGEE